ncbi:N-acetylglucosamine-binding protein GbpA [Vibrio sp. TBV020]|uniref:N-acetylglucosamine-binding protein GbpA n=1 Tax=Vibrio sp. TBV020 TaxID=3137398 RepID=UPI0038CD3E2A
MSKIKTSLIPLSTLLFSAGALSHGYVSAIDGGVAEARGTLCSSVSTQSQKNANCGQVQWEPQSIEGPEGFPIGGPPDGKIASGGLTQFSALNEQTATRWVKTPISHGLNTFEWTFTANHVTRDWKYYITKADWNPNTPLTRNSFELTPFCTVDGGMVQPPKRVQHECNVPKREGYQVILAVWDVGDTAAAFYNVLDVRFDGNQPEQPDPSAWVKGGQINPGINLQRGDVVYTRVFDSTGERRDLSSRLKIKNAKHGLANNWSYKLAKKINRTQSLIKAGNQVSDDKFTPIHGTNPIYLKNGNDLVRVELAYEVKDPEPIYDLDISGVSPEYSISESPVTLELTLTATGDMTTELTVYNHAQNTLAYTQVSLEDGVSEPVSLELSKSEPGHHMLVTKFKDSEGNLIGQQTADFHLVEKGKDCGSDPEASNYPHWDATTTYTGGEKVSYENLVWQAKYWISGAAPDSSDAWQLLSDVTLPWAKGKVYNGGDNVVFNGRLYEAKWWVNTSPSESPSVWLDKGPFSCN